MKTLKTNFGLLTALKILFIALLVSFSTLLMADNKDTLKETAIYAEEMHLLDIYFSEEPSLLPVETKPGRIEIYNQQDELIYTSESADSKKDISLNNLLDNSEFLMEIDNTYYYQLTNDRYPVAQ